MPEIVGTLLPREGREERANAAAYARDSALCKLAQVRLEFAEGHLDRIKIGRVLRQIAKRCAGGLDRLRDAGHFVGGHIVYHDDIVGLEHRYEALFDIGQEQFSVHWSLDQHRGHHSVVTQRRYEGQGLPLSERHVIDQSHPAWTTTVEPHHVGVHAGLVDKYQLGRIKQALLTDPFAARPRYILTFLLGGPQALLLAGDVMTIQETPQRGLAGANVLLAQLRLNFLQSRVWPLLNNRQYPLLVLLQRRRAPATRLRLPTARIAQPLHPFDRRAYGDAKNFRRLVTRHPRCNRCDQSLPQIARIGLRHCPALLR